MNNVKNKKTNIKKIFIILCLITILLYGAQYVKTFSLYVYNNVKEFFLKTNNFYFYSDKLKLNMAEYNIENWSGIEDYVININMNSIENNLVKCDSDIEYNIEYSCSDNIMCQSSKANSTIYADTNTDNFILTITPITALNTGDVVWVEVSATSVAPYVKTISAKFQITVGNLGMSYNIEDEPNSQFIEFNVVNTLNFYTIDEAFGEYSVGDKIDLYKYLDLSDENKNKCHSLTVTLTFDPREVYLDMASEMYLKSIAHTTTQIGNANYVNSLTFKVDAITSVSVKFYKKDLTKDYTYPKDNNPCIVGITYY